MNALEAKIRENERYSSNHVMCNPGTADKDRPVSSLQLHRIKTRFLFLTKMQSGLRKRGTVSYQLDMKLCQTMSLQRPAAITDT